MKSPLIYQASNELRRFSVVERVDPETGEILIGIEREIVKRLASSPSSSERARGAGSMFARTQAGSQFASRQRRDTRQKGR